MGFSFEDELLEFVKKDETDRSKELFGRYILTKAIDAGGTDSSETPALGGESHE